MVSVNKQKAISLLENQVQVADLLRASEGKDNGAIEDLSAEAKKVLVLIEKSSSEKVDDVELAKLILLRLHMSSDRIVANGSTALLASVGTALALLGYDTDSPVQDLPEHLFPSNKTRQ